MCADNRIPTTVTRPGDSGDPHAIGPYRISRVLGRGAMGIVYLATDERTQSPVALKVLPRDLALEPRRIARFVTEARAAGMLDHPAIARVHDSGVSDGFHYISMEVLEGGSLADIVRRAMPDCHRSFAELLANPSPEPLTGQRKRAAKAAYFYDVARTLETVTRALAEAHEHGVLHRDIKPSNILFDRDGQPRLCDFGLARIEGGVPNTSSRAGNPCTPAYAAPEQALGRREDVVKASDIYSLGATLYECLTGRLPFADVRPDLLPLAIREYAPRDPRAIDSEIPEALERIALGCLEKQPARRYGSASVLADDLHRFVSGVDPIFPPLSKLLKLFRRLWPRRWKLSAAIAGIAALAVGSAFLIDRYLATVELAAYIRDNAASTLSNDDFSLAESQLTEAARLNASDPLVYLFRALARRCQGLNADDDILLAKQSHLDPYFINLLDSATPPSPPVVPVTTTDPQTKALLRLFAGIVFNRSNQLDAALANFSAASEDNPKFAQPCLQEALVQDRLGHWPDAIAAIDRYLEKKLDAPQRQIGQALSNSFKGDFAAALAALDPLPQPLLTPFTLNLRARTKMDLFDEQGRTNQALLSTAIEDLKSAGAENLRVLGISVGLAAAFAFSLPSKVTTDDDLAPLRLVEAILARDRSNSDAWLVRGYLRERRGDFDGALESYDKASELVPSNAWPRHNAITLKWERGGREFGAGDKTRARADWQEALDEWKNLMNLLPSYSPVYQRRFTPFGVLGCRLSHAIKRLNPDIDTDLDRAIDFLRSVESRMSSGPVESELGTFLLNRAEKPEGSVAESDYRDSAVFFAAARMRGRDTPHVQANLLYLHYTLKTDPPEPVEWRPLLEHCRAYGPKELLEEDPINLALAFGDSDLPDGSEVGCQLIDACQKNNTKWMKPQFSAKVSRVLARCVR